MEMHQYVIWLVELGVILKQFFWLNFLILWQWTFLFLGSVLTAIILKTKGLDEVMILRWSYPLSWSDFKYESFFYYSFSHHYPHTQLWICSKFSFVLWLILFFIPYPLIEWFLAIISVLHAIAKQLLLSNTELIMLFFSQKSHAS